MRAWLFLCAWIATLTLAGAQTPLWKDDFSGPVLHWKIEPRGGAQAEGALDPASPDGGPALRLSSRSAQAPNVWLSLAAPDSFPVHGGDDLILRVRAAGKKAGRAFVAVRFTPAGGEARFYLPQGDFAGRLCSYDFEVPPEAKEAQIIGGVEGPTEGLWLDSFSVVAPLLPRSSLRAQWVPRDRETVFPQAGTPARTLLALDVSKLPPDGVLLAATLQGLVNRKEPRVYLYYKPEDRFWADWLVEEHYVDAIKEVDDLPSLIAAFRSEIPGVIVYDPALPASRHAAVMLGSLQDCPVTGRETAATLGLPIVSDLTGRWKRNVDAYREIWEKYHARFEGHVLAVHYPLMEQQGPRDYLFQQRIFTFWVSGYGDNDPGGDPAAEMDFAHEVLAATPPNIPVMGWWSYGDGHGIPEYDAIRLCSSYAKFLAGSEFCTNLSVLSGIHVPPWTFRQPAHANSMVSAVATEMPASDKLYASLSVLDSGDSQWYWQHYQAKLWRDPARGTVPIDWSLNPTVADVMPPVLAWFYRQATPRDLFYCAISGLGYMNPRVYAARFRPADRARIWKEYLAELDRYLQALDLDVVGLYAGGWGEPRGNIDEVYDRYFKGAPSLRGILSDFGRHDGTSFLNATETIDGKPVFHTLMRWMPWTKQEQMRDQLSQEQASVDFTLKEFLGNAPKERPGFMSGLILSWTMRPGLVEKVAEALPADVELVNADQLIELWDGWHQSAP